MGELILGRKLGWRGMAWGLFFGTFPDLDVFISPFLDEVTQLKWHRGISHSVLLMFVGAFVFMKPLSWLHQKRGLSMARTWWFVFLTWSTHVLIDVFTTYGTQIWEPLSDARVSLNNMSIIDPLFTLPLLICVLISLIRLLSMVILLIRYFLISRDRRIELSLERPSEPFFSGRAAKLALTLSCLYALLSFAMKFKAMSVIDERMAHEVPNGQLIQVAPTIGNIILWRGVAETEKGYWITYWSPMDDEAATWDFYPKHAELTQRFREEPLYQGLEWFSRDHWVARRLPHGEILMIDMRFGEVRDLPSGQQIPMFQWILRYNQDGIFEAPIYRPSDLDIKGSLSLLWTRLSGDLQSWQSMKPF